MSTTIPTEAEQQRVQLNVEIEQGILRELKVIAAEEGTPLGAMVREGLLFVLEGHHGTGARWSHPFSDLDEDVG